MVPMNFIVICIFSR